MTEAANDHQQRYVQKIEEMYVKGEENAYEVFLNLAAQLESGSSCYDKHENENDLEYVRRCAILDFDDGSTQGAIYQEIWNETINA